MPGKLKSVQGRKPTKLARPDVTAASNESTAVATNEQPVPTPRLAWQRLGFLRPVGGEAPHRLLNERLYLGRDAACDIIIPGIDVALLHCVMEFRDGHWYVRDLKDNGLAINGKQLKEGWLLPGATLTISRRQFSVEYTSTENPPVTSVDRSATELDNSSSAGPSTAAVTSRGRITCPVCQQRLRLNPEFAGRRGRCMNCQTRLLIANDLCAVSIADEKLRPCNSPTHAASR